MATYRIVAPAPKIATYRIIASASNPTVVRVQAVNPSPQVVTVKTSIEAYQSRLLPSGGNAGQVAAKASDQDYDVVWQNAGEASNGLPSGGTEGQIAVKTSNADYDTEWTSLTNMTLIFENQLI